MLCRFFLFLKKAHRLPDYEVVLQESVRLEMCLRNQRSVEAAYMARRADDKWASEIGMISRCVSARNATRQYVLL